MSTTNKCSYCNQRDIAVVGTRCLCSVCLLILKQEADEKFKQNVDPKRQFDSEKFEKIRDLKRTRYGDCNIKSRVKQAKITSDRVLEEQHRIIMRLKSTDNLMVEYEPFASFKQTDRYIKANRSQNKHVIRNLRKDDDVSIREAAKLDPVCVEAINRRYLTEINTVNINYTRGICISGFGGMPYKNHRILRSDMNVCFPHPTEILAVVHEDLVFESGLNKTNLEDCPAANIENIFAVKQGGYLDGSETMYPTVGLEKEDYDEFLKTMYKCHGELEKMRAHVIRATAMTQEGYDPENRMRLRKAIVAVINRAGGLSQYARLYYKSTGRAEYFLEKAWDNKWHLNVTKRFLKDTTSDALREFDWTKLDEFAKVWKWCYNFKVVNCNHCHTNNVVEIPNKFRKWDQSKLFEEEIDMEFRTDDKEPRVETVCDGTYIAWNHTPESILSATLPEELVRYYLTKNDSRLPSFYWKMAKFLRLKKNPCICEPTNTGVSQDIYWDPTHATPIEFGRSADGIDIDPYSFRAVPDWHDYSTACDDLVNVPLSTLMDHRRKNIITSEPGEEMVETAVKGYACKCGAMAEVTGRDCEKINLTPTMEFDLLDEIICGACGGPLFSCDDGKYCEEVWIVYEKLVTRGWPMISGTLLEELELLNYLDGSMLDAKTMNDLLSNDYRIALQAFTRSNTTWIKSHNGISEEGKNLLRSYFNNLEIIEGRGPRSDHGFFSTCYEAVYKLMLEASLASSEFVITFGRPVNLKIEKDKMVLVKMLNTWRLRERTVVDPSWCLCNEACNCFANLRRKPKMVAGPMIMSWTIEKIGDWINKNGITSAIFFLPTGRLCEDFNNRIPLMFDEGEIFIEGKNIITSTIGDTHPYVQNGETAQILTNGTIIKFGLEWWLLKTVKVVGDFIVRSAAKIDDVNDLRQIAGTTVKQNKIKMKIPKIKKGGLIGAIKAPAIEIVEVEIYPALYSPFLTRNIHGDQSYQDLVEYGIAIAVQRWQLKDKIIHESEITTEMIEDHAYICCLQMRRLDGCMAFLNSITNRDRAWLNLAKSAGLGGIEWLATTFFEVYRSSSPGPLWHYYDAIADLVRSNELHKIVNVRNEGQWILLDEIKRNFMSNVNIYVVNVVEPSHIKPCTHSIATSDSKGDYACVCCGVVKVANVNDKCNGCSGVASCTNSHLCTHPCSGPESHICNQSHTHNYVKCECCGKNCCETCKICVSIGNWLDELNDELIDKPDPLVVPRPRPATGFRGAPRGAKPTKPYSHASKDVFIKRRENLMKIVDEIVNKGRSTDDVATAVKTNVDEDLINCAILIIKTQGMDYLRYLQGELGSVENKIIVKNGVSTIVWAPLGESYLDGTDFSIETMPIRTIPVTGDDTCAYTALYYVTNDNIGTIEDMRTVTKVYNNFTASDIINYSLKAKRNIAVVTEKVCIIAKSIMDDEFGIIIHSDAYPSNMRNKDWKPNHWFPGNIKQLKPTKPLAYPGFNTTTDEINDTIKFLNLETSTNSFEGLHMNDKIRLIAAKSVDELRLKESANELPSISYESDGMYLRNVQTGRTDFSRGIVREKISADLEEYFKHIGPVSTEVLESGAIKYFVEKYGDWPDSERCLIDQVKMAIYAIDTALSRVTISLNDPLSPYVTWESVRVVAVSAGYYRVPKIKGNEKSLDTIIMKLSSGLTRLFMIANSDEDFMYFNSSVIIKAGHYHVSTCKYSVGSIFRELVAINAKMLDKTNWCTNVRKLVEDSDTTDGVFGCGKTTDIIDIMVASEEVMTVVCMTKFALRGIYEKYKGKTQHKILSVERAKIEKVKTETLLIDEATMVMPEDLIIMLTNNVKKLIMYGGSEQIGAVDFSELPGFRAELGLLDYVKNKKEKTKCYRIGPPLINDLMSVVPRLEIGKKEKTNVKLLQWMTFDRIKLIELIKTYAIDLILNFYTSGMNKCKNLGPTNAKVHSYQGGQQPRVLVLHWDPSGRKMGIHTRRKYILSAASRSSEQLVWLTIDSGINFNNFKDLLVHYCKTGGSEDSSVIMNEKIMLESLRLEQSRRAMYASKEQWFDLREAVWNTMRGSIASMHPNNYIVNDQPKLWIYKLWDKIKSIFSEGKSEKSKFDRFTGEITVESIKSYVKKNFNADVEVTRDADEFVVKYGRLLSIKFNSKSKEIIKKFDPLGLITQQRINDMCSCNEGDCSYDEECLTIKITRKDCQIIESLNAIYAYSQQNGRMDVYADVSIKPDKGCSVCSGIKVYKDNVIMLVIHERYNNITRRRVEFKSSMQDEVLEFCCRFNLIQMANLLGMQIIEKENVVWKGIDLRDSAITKSIWNERLKHAGAFIGDMITSGTSKCDWYYQSNNEYCDKVSKRLGIKCEISEKLSYTDTSRGCIDFKYSKRKRGLAMLVNDKLITNVPIKSSDILLTESQMRILALTRCLINDNYEICKEIIMTKIPISRKIGAMTLEEVIEGLSLPLEFHKKNTTKTWQLILKQYSQKKKKEAINPRSILRISNNQFKSYGKLIKQEANHLPIQPHGMAFKDEGFECTVNQLHQFSMTRMARKTEEFHVITNNPENMIINSDWNCKMEAMNKAIWLSNEIVLSEALNYAKNAMKTAIDKEKNELIESTIVKIDKQLNNESVWFNMDGSPIIKHFKADTLIVGTNIMYMSIEMINEKLDQFRKVCGLIYITDTDMVERSGMNLLFHNAQVVLKPDWYTINFLNNLMPIKIKDHWLIGHMDGWMMGLAKITVTRVDKVEMLPELVSGLEFDEDLIEIEIPKIELNLVTLITQQTVINKERSKCPKKLWKALTRRNLRSDTDRRDVEAYMRFAMQSVLYSRLNLWKRYNNNPKMMKTIVESVIWNQSKYSGGAARLLSFFSNNSEFGGEEKIKELATMLYAYFGEIYKFNFDLQDLVKFIKENFEDMLNFLPYNLRRIFDVVDSLQLEIIETKRVYKSAQIASFVSKPIVNPMLKPASGGFSINALINNNRAGKSHLFQPLIDKFLSEPDLDMNWPILINGKLCNKLPGNLSKNDLCSIGIFLKMSAYELNPMLHDFQIDEHRMREPEIMIYNCCNWSALSALKLGEIDECDLVICGHRNSQICWGVIKKDHDWRPPKDGLPFDCYVGAPHTASWENHWHAWVGKGLLDEDWEGGYKLAQGQIVKCLKILNYLRNLNYRKNKTARSEWSRCDTCMSKQAVRLGVCWLCAIRKNLSNDTEPTDLISKLDPDNSEAKSYIDRRRAMRMKNTSRPSIQGLIVVVAGTRGSGKSMFGLFLAELLKCKLFDTDSSIINDIVKRIRTLNNEIIVLCAELDEKWKVTSLNSLESQFQLIRVSITPEGEDEFELAVKRLRKKGLSNITCTELAVKPIHSSYVPDKHFTLHEAVEWWYDITEDSLSEVIDKFVPFEITKGFINKGNTCYAAATITSMAVCASKSCRNEILLKSTSTGIDKFTEVGKLERGKQHDAFEFLERLRVYMDLRLVCKVNYVIECTDCLQDHVWSDVTCWQTVQDFDEESICNPEIEVIDDVFCRDNSMQPDDHEMKPDSMTTTTTYEWQSNPKMMLKKLATYSKLEKKLVKSITKYYEEVVEINGVENVAQSMVVHIGSSPYSGHYISFLKLNDEWTMYNDSNVSAMEPKEFLDSEKTASIYWILYAETSLFDIDIPIVAEYGYNYLNNLLYISANGTLPVIMSNPIDEKPNVPIDQKGVRVYEEYEEQFYMGWSLEQLRIMRQEFSARANLDKKKQNEIDEIFDAAVRIVSDNTATNLFVIPIYMEIGLNESEIKLKISEILDAIGDIQEKNFVTCEIAFLGFEAERGQILELYDGIITEENFTTFQCYHIEMLYMCAIAMFSETGKPIDVIVLNSNIKSVKLYDMIMLVDRMKLTEGLNNVVTNKVGPTFENVLHINNFKLPHRILVDITSRVGFIDGCASHLLAMYGDNVLNNPDKDGYKLSKFCNRGINVLLAYVIDDVKTYYNVELEKTDPYTERTLSISNYFDVKLNPATLRCPLCGTMVVKEFNKDHERVCKMLRGELDETDSATISTKLDSSEDEKTEDSDQDTDSDTTSSDESDYGDGGDIEELEVEEYMIEDYQLRQRVGWPSLKATAYDKALHVGMHVIGSEKLDVLFTPSTINYCVRECFRKFFEINKDAREVVLDKIYNQCGFRPMVSYEELLKLALIMQVNIITNYSGIAWFIFDAAYETIAIRIDDSGDLAHASLAILPEHLMTGIERKKSSVKVRELTKTEVKRASKYKANKLPRRIQRAMDPLTVCEIVKASRGCLVYNKLNDGDLIYVLSTDGMQTKWVQAVVMLGGSVSYVSLCEDSVETCCAFVNTGYNIASSMSRKERKPHFEDITALNNQSAKLYKSVKGKSLTVNNPLATRLFVGHYDNKRHHMFDEEKYLKAFEMKNWVIGFDDVDKETKVKLLIKRLVRTAVDNGVIYKTIYVDDELSYQMVILMGELHGLSIEPHETNLNQVIVTGFESDIDRMNDLYREYIETSDNNIEFVNTLTDEWVDSTINVGFVKSKVTTELLQRCTVDLGGTHLKGRWSIKLKSKELQESGIERWLTEEDGVVTIQQPGLAASAGHEDYFKKRKFTKVIGNYYNIDLSPKLSVNVYRNDEYNRRSIKSTLMHSNDHEMVYDMIVEKESEPDGYDCKLIDQIIEILNARLTLVSDDSEVIITAASNKDELKKVIKGVKSVMPNSTIICLSDKITTDVENCSIVNVEVEKGRQLAMLRLCALFITANTNQIYVINGRGWIDNHSDEFRLLQKSKFDEIDSELMTVYGAGHSPCNLKMAKINLMARKENKNNVELFKEFKRSFNLYGSVYGADEWYCSINLNLECIWLFDFYIFNAQCYVKRLIARILKNWKVNETRKRLTGWYDMTAIKSDVTSTKDKESIIISIKAKLGAYKDQIKWSKDLKHLKDVSTLAEWLYNEGYDSGKIDASLLIRLGLFDASRATDPYDKQEKDKEDIVTRYKKISGLKHSHVCREGHKYEHEHKGGDRPHKGYAAECPTCRRTLVGDVEIEIDHLDNNDYLDLVEQFLRGKSINIPNKEYEKIERAIGCPICYLFDNKPELMGRLITKNQIFVSSHGAYECADEYSACEEFGTPVTWLAFKGHGAFRRNRTPWKYYEINRLIVKTDTADDAHQIINVSRPGHYGFDESYEIEEPFYTPSAIISILGCREAHIEPDTEMDEPAFCNFCGKRTNTVFENITGVRTLRSVKETLDALTGNVTITKDETTNMKDTSFVACTLTEQLEGNCCMIVTYDRTDKILYVLNPKAGEEQSILPKDKNDNEIKDDQNRSEWFKNEEFSPNKISRWWSMSDKDMRFVTSRYTKEKQNLLKEKTRLLDNIDALALMEFQEVPKYRYNLMTLKERNSFVGYTDLGKAASVRPIYGVDPDEVSSEVIDLWEDVDLSDWNVKYHQNDKSDENMVLRMIASEGFVKKVVKTTWKKYPVWSRAVLTKALNQEANAVTGRLGSVVKLRKYRLNVKEEAERFVKVYFREDSEQIINKWSKKPIAFDANDCKAWLSDREDWNKIANDLVKIMGEGFVRTQLNKLNVHVKTESLLKDEPVMYQRAVQGRIIVWQAKVLCAMFASCFKRAKDRLKSILKQKVIYADGLTPDELSARLRACDAEWFLEDDLTKQDRQTDNDLIDVEFAIYQILGVHKDVLKAWRRIHETWRFFGKEVRGLLDAMRLTGQATTALGNLIIDMLVHSRFVEENDMIINFIVMLGDDNLMLLKKKPSMTTFRKIIEDYYNMQCKPKLNRNSGMFISMLVYRNHLGTIECGPAIPRLKRRLEVTKGGLHTRKTQPTGIKCELGLIKWLVENQPVGNVVFIDVSELDEKKFNEWLKGKGSESQVYLTSIDKTDLDEVIKFSLKINNVLRPLCIVSPPLSGKTMTAKVLTIENIKFVDVDDMYDPYALVNMGLDPIFNKAQWREEKTKRMKAWYAKHHKPKHVYLVHDIDDVNAIQGEIIGIYAPTEKCIAKYVDGPTRAIREKFYRMSLADIETQIKKNKYTAKIRYFDEYDKKNIWIKDALSSRKNREYEVDKFKKHNGKSENRECSDLLVINDGNEETIVGDLRSYFAGKIYEPDVLRSLSYLMMLGGFKEAMNLNNAKGLNLKLVNWFNADDCINANADYYKMNRDVILMFLGDLLAMIKRPQLTHREYSVITAYDPIKDNRYRR